MPSNETNHVHRFKIGGRSRKVTHLRCECGEGKERPATKAEAKYMDRWWKRSEIEAKLMHGTSWDFFGKFKTQKRVGRPHIFNGKKFYDYQSSWKYKGYDLMKRVARWAKKYPKDVFICGIDDSVHASSDIVFILHRLRAKLWGTTVIVITQCDGQPPHEFFMYPGHMKEIHAQLGAFLKLPRLYKD